jgi:putative MATE family efflux protein
MKTAHPQNREELLGKAPMLPLLLKMSLPAVAAQLVNLLYSIVDSIYIGHIESIGTDALAGIGVTSSLIILISAFAQFVGGGGAPLASIALGEGNRDRAGKILGNGFLLLCFFAVTTASVSYLFMKPILYLIGATELTVGYATDYLSIYLLGTFFVMVSTGLNTFINTQGRPAIAMFSVLIGAVANIILDPIFIYGFGLNVKGAAIATVISQGLSAAFILAFLFSKKATLRIEKRYMKPEGKIIGAIFSLGVSPFVMASTEAFVGFVLNGTLSAFGDIYVSALSIMQRAMQIVSVPLAGISAGYIPIVSYNYGNKNPARVKEAFKIALGIKFFFNLTVCLLIILFPAFVASLFTDDPILVETVVRYMPLFFAGMTIFGLQRTCQNTFVALGQAKVSLFIALLRKVILLIPLAVVLPHLMNGVVGVYAAEAIADATAALSCTAIFLCIFPKILQKITPKRDEH